MKSEIEKILKYSNYYSAGQIEYGIDGPEINSNKCYISIYHYLQYIGENPKQFDTKGLGLYLSGKPVAYSTCKYMSQPFVINKFDTDLLKEERKNFQSFRKNK